MSESFNLVDEPWIPVLYHDGRFARVGIQRVLEEAGSIRQIAASNPMDRVALVRFLLAVLYWCRGNPVGEEEKNLILREGRFPAEWFGKLQKSRDCFNLLGEGKRFYQDSNIWCAVKKKAEDEAKKKQNKPKQSGVKADGKDTKKRDGISFRPVGDLLQEFPTDSKIIHFRHLQDDKYGFCPACCAIGLIRFSAFASAYAQVIPAGINGPTPAYVMSTNSTLLATLVTHWPKLTVVNDKPAWESEGGAALKKNAIGALAVFTWQPRRIWLGELSEEHKACACCGEKVSVICRIAFGPGLQSPFTGGGKDKKFWPKDPHILLITPQKKMKPKQNNSREKTQKPTVSSPDDGGNTDKGQPISFPSPNLPVGIHTRFWRIALRTVLNSTPQGNSIINGSQVMGPAANKALYQDASAFHLPSIANANRNQAGKWLDTVGKASESLLMVLHRATPNPKRKHPNRKGALETLTASLETNLKALFPSQANGEQAIDTIRILTDEYARTIRHVVESTNSESPLRCRQAHRQAESLLRQTMEKIQAEDQ